MDTVISSMNSLVTDYWIAKYVKLAVFARKDTSSSSAKTHLRSVSYVLPDTDLQSVEKISRGNTWGRFTIFLAAYALLAGKYTGEEELAVTAFFSPGQPPNLLFHLCPTTASLLKKFLRDVREEVLETLKYKDFDPEDLHTHLVSHGINPHLNAGIEFYDGIAPEDSTSPTRLRLHVLHDSDTTTLVLYFTESVMQKDIARQFLRHYHHLLRTLGDGMDTTIGSINLLTGEDKQALDLLRPARIALPHAGIMDVFGEVAARNAERMALTCGNVSYTYAELNHKINGLARYFREEWAIRPGARVGLMTKRSEWITIGMLAILKTGAAFVPIDPENPPERRMHIIRHSAIQLLLTESENIFSLGEYTGPVFATDLGDIPGRDSGPDPAGVAKGSDLAYIIYTSGTTGTPKGVMIEHHSVVNYSRWIKTGFGLDERSSTVLTSSYGFDLGYTGIFGTLLIGGHLHIFERDSAKYPEELLEYIVRQSITFLKTTPSFFYILVHLPSFASLARDLALKTIFLGGEPIQTRDIEKYHLYKKDTVFINHYGPTETTIGIAACILDNERITEYANLNLIGKPALNNEILILNEELQEQPFGLAGELCMTGEGVGRGYYNAPELTADRFVVLPDSQQRIYRSGDYGKKLPDGNISLAGRKDDQHKIRGYRVELAEIEAVILENLPVTEVKVIADKSESRCRLWAYVRTNAPIQTKQWLEMLSPNLPDYMLPAGFIGVAEFPLSANGKKDIGALVQRYGCKDGEEQDYIAPGDQTEWTLASIWQEVLQTPRIGANQSFFSLGANSLLIVRANALINRHYPQITIADLFAYNDISALAAFIRETGETRREIADAYIALPKNFFRSSDEDLPGESEGAYAFAVEGPAYERFRRHAAANDISISNLAVAFFFFVLAEASGVDDVPVQVCRTAGGEVTGDITGEVTHVRVNLETVRDPADLYDMINTALEDKSTSDRYRIADMDKIHYTGKEKGRVLPFVMIGPPSSHPSIAGAGDLSLSAIPNDAGKIDFSFRYDALVFRQQPIEAMVREFIRIIESI